MIKALVLIFEPQSGWEGVAERNRGVGFLLGLHLLPMLIFCTAAQLAGLHYFDGRKDSFDHVVRATPRLLEVFGATEFLLSLVVVLAGAYVIKALGDTFHSRHRFSQCLAVAIHGLSPLFLVRLLDAFAWMSPWISLPVGVVLSWGVLYQGIPRVLEPDPPHAFGLFLGSALALGVLAALARSVSLLVLWGRVPGLH